jgi:Protein of unknown function (DUF2971)
MEERPTHFYRYRSLSGKSAEYLKKTLLDHELYFPKPTTFNDPFDCLPSFNLEATVTEVIRYYENAISRRKPNAPGHQITSEALAFFYEPGGNPNDPGYLKRAQQLHAQHVQETIGILCLSETANDILMWSHYADFHKGVCLQFDGQSTFFANAHQVNYLVERPRVNPFRDSTEQVMEAVLLGKAKHWSYEKEWRLIQYVGGPKAYKFPPEALVGLVLGACISPQDKQLVLGWLKERKAPIKVLQAVISDKSYEIECQ